MEIMFWVIFTYIIFFSSFNIILYWQQLKHKILTRFFGRRDFTVWLSVDLGLIIILIILMVVFFIFCPQPKIFSDSILIKVGGLVIIIFGIFISSLAFKRLGFYHSFSSSLFTRKKYKLIKKGVFKYFKHPMYFGWFLVFLGATVFLNSIYALIFGIEGTIYVIIRSGIEECELALL